MADADPIDTSTLANQYRSLQQQLAAVHAELDSAVSDRDRLTHANADLDQQVRDLRWENTSLRDVITQLHADLAAIQELPRGWDASWGPKTGGR